jgi:hypothetical protein
MGYFKIPGAQGQELVTAQSPILAAVKNNIPGGMIQDIECQQFYNRLAAIDGINRTRPGIKNLVNTGANPILKVLFKDNSADNYLVTDGTKLWNWNTVSSTLTLRSSGLPFSSALGPLNGCCANAVAFLNQGAGLFYWDGTNFVTVSMPVQSPLASFPIWASQRLIYAATGTNNIVFGDLDSSQPPNFGPSNNSTTVTVKLNNDLRDAVTGICQYGISAGTTLVGQKSKLWAIFSDPTLSVANFSKQIVSNVIGVAEHNTFKQLGNDALFLSETGNGVFAVSSLVGSNNIGLSGKKSLAISPDIERINWAAVNTARAVVWQDLYILSVPLDGSSTPNAMFIYSAAMDAWQGIWTGATNLTAPLSSPALTITSMDINPTQVAANGLTAGSELIYGLSNGNLALQTKPRDAIYNDLAIGGASVPIQSSILSKSYSPLAKASSYMEAAGTTFNQISPYVARFRFPSSTAPVNLDLVSDVGTLSGYRTGLVTNSKLLQLPHNLPWNLDTRGDKYQSVNVQDVSVCQELALQLSGSGDWRMRSIEFGAFVAEPKDIS